MIFLNIKQPFGVIVSYNKVVTVPLTKTDYDNKLIMNDIKSLLFLILTLSFLILLNHCMPLWQIKATLLWNEIF